MAKRNFELLIEKQEESIKQMKEKLEEVIKLSKDKIAEAEKDLKQLREDKYQSEIEDLISAIRDNKLNPVEILNNINKKEDKSNSKNISRIKTGQVKELESTKEEPKVEEHQEKLAI